MAVTDHQPPLPATLPFQNATKSFIKSSPSPVVGTPSLEDQLRVASASPSVATQTLPSVEPSLQSDTIHVTPSVKDASRAASPTVEDEVANQTPFEAAPAVQAAVVVVFDQRALLLRELDSGRVHRGHLT